MQLPLFKDMAATPASVCRIPIFSPTRRPQAVSAWEVETSWGSAVITGRLGQQHRDLIDAARMVAEKEEWTADGRLHLLVDPAKLRSALGGDGVNYQRIDDWLKDLMLAIVKIHITTKDIKVTGGLVAEYVDADASPPCTRGGAFNKNRRYLKISFGTGWSKLVEEDDLTKYPLRQVVGLKHGFSQAVARYCFSHQKVHESIAGLTDRLGAGGRLRDRRAELCDDSVGLQSMGIEVVGDRVKWSGASKVLVAATKVPVGASKVPVKMASFN